MSLTMAYGHIGPVPELEEESLHEDDSVGELDFMDEEVVDTSLMGLEDWTEEDSDAEGLMPGCQCTSVSRIRRVKPADRQADISRASLAGDRDVVRHIPTMLRVADLMPGVKCNKQLTVPLPQDQLYRYFSPENEYTWVKLRVISPDPSYDPAAVRVEVRRIFGGHLFTYGQNDLDADSQGHLWLSFCLWLKPVGSDLAAAENPATPSASSHAPVHTLALPSPPLLAAPRGKDPPVATPVKTLPRQQPRRGEGERDLAVVAPT
ncbi:hypothetical protein A1Q1_00451 [Trichosporon asahii var. asahii CBS 2479]|uniref:Uncharacterized protein n=1 Tax=Trichosporon asahii var. asahii (strain ATCC 90039 / CBS 2479 / JCM 2466 / KCTC 7840 / NBRC 103889/ NCYC 2677 / UAMH 7654) TaxID=1186058 RepID=J5R1X5_TRIAS|nr:hypothetical protein A1Q1_00451 [Trichosporon asahii var. asahii CBS 2479]EJT50293.1 hypothetical protein A1Q1_00451 [Trichosporon asahii var. asahii CBS 2479]